MSSPAHDKPTKTPYDENIAERPFVKITRLTMKKEQYSNSRLSVAVECEYKYYLRYFKKLYPSIEFSFFIVGHVVHQIIEDFHRSRIYLPSFSREEQLAWCMEKLDKAFKSKFGSVVFIEFKNYQHELNAALSTFDNKEPTHTKRWKEDYASVFEAKANMVNKLAEACMPKILFKKSFTELYEQAEQCLANFIEIHQTAPVGNRVIIHEFRIDPPIDVFGADFGGRIDRLDIKFQEDGDVEFSVYDYKTGKTYWKEDQISKNSQLINYSNALQKTYGKLPTTIGIMDLYHGKVVAGKPNQDHIDEFLTKLEGQVKYAQDLEASFQGIPESEINFHTPWDRGEGYKCKSCEYAYDPDVKCPFVGGM